MSELVEHLGLPVVTTIHGKGALPEDHPLSGGVLPIGDPTCSTLFSRADLVLALGTSFSQVSTGSWTVEFPAQLIHVDLDGAGIGRSVPAALKVAGDVRRVLGQLNEAVAAIERRPSSAWAEEVAGLPARLERVVEGAAGAELVRTMRCLLPDDAIVVGDAQGWGSWLIHHFPVDGTGRVLWPIHFGTLGFSVPGAIGVQAAFPERRVVAACGDGGFMFCSNELATAVQHRLDIVVIVVNDAGFGSVRNGQVHRFGAERVFAADLHNPDFVAYARSFGCWAHRVQRPEEFGPALKEALNAGRPAVVEVVFPLPRTPGDYGLENSAEVAG